MPPSLQCLKHFGDLPGWQTHVIIHNPNVVLSTPINQSYKFPLITPILADRNTDLHTSSPAIFMPVAYFSATTAAPPCRSSQYRKLGHFLRHQSFAGAQVFQTAFDCPVERWLKAITTSTKQTRLIPSCWKTCMPAILIHSPQRWEVDNWGLGVPAIGFQCGPLRHPCLQPLESIPWVLPVQVKQVPCRTLR